MVGRPPRLRQGGHRRWALTLRLLARVAKRPLVRRCRVSPVAVSGGEHRPNKRLKLPAPGLGRNCVCAPAAFVVVSMDVAPTAVGAAA